MANTFVAETLLPDVRALEWWLSHRYPNLYGHPGNLDEKGEEGEPELPRGDRAKELAEALAYFRRSAGRELPETPRPAP